MQKILIIGATSAIAEATARHYAERGAQLYLAARNAGQLSAIAEDLLVRGAGSVRTVQFDVNDATRRPEVIGAAFRELGSIDVVLLAHGTLPNQQQCEASEEVALEEFKTNATSTIALLTILANLMMGAGQGTIAVISSVAGDRGRASNYLYGSAKAAVTEFLSGLRQRMHRHGVNVLTIKPGFVDTPMTKDFKKGALWAKPGDIAHGIVKAVERKRSVVYLPWFWRGIMMIIRAIPESLFKRINL
jgi:short-subunit dehydrogenase